MQQRKKSDDDVIDERLRCTGKILWRLERWTVSLTSLALLTFHTFQTFPAFPIDFFMFLLLRVAWLVCRTLVPCHFFVMCRLAEGRATAGRSEKSFDERSCGGTFFPSCLPISSFEFRYDYYDYFFVRPHARSGLASSSSS